MKNFNIEKFHVYAHSSNDEAQMKTGCKWEFLTFGNPGEKEYGYWWAPVGFLVLLGFLLWGGFLWLLLLLLNNLLSFQSGRFSWETQLCWIWSEVVKVSRYDGPSWTLDETRFLLCLRTWQSPEVALSGNKSLLFKAKKRVQVQAGVVEERRIVHFSHAASALLLLGFSGQFLYGRRTIVWMHWCKNVRLANLNFKLRRC